MSYVQIHISPMGVSKGSTTRKIVSKIQRFQGQYTISRKFTEMYWNFMEIHGSHWQFCWISRVAFKISSLLLIPQKYPLSIFTYTIVLITCTFLSHRLHARDVPYPFTVGFYHLYSIRSCVNQVWLAILLLSHAMDIATWQVYV